MTNEFGVLELANGKLSLELLPSERSASWGEISLFALTFDGYVHRRSFDECAEIANTAAKHFHETGVLPQSLTDLRTCLFFEQRRYHHFGWAPGADVMQYIRATLGAIRAKVATGALD